MIAPLCKRIKTNGDRYLSFSVATGVALQDFIYAESITDSDVQECLQLLLKECGSIGLKYLLPSSKLYRQLNQFKSIYQRQRVNVTIPLNDSYLNYYAGLTKHTKQNIRTAYNRMKTDNKEFLIQYFLWGEIPKLLLKKLMDVYIQRQKSKYHSNTTILKNEYFLRYFHFHTIALSKLKSSLYIVLKIDNEIAAFLAGYISRNRDYVLVPRLAINEEFNRYSPGIVLINESMKLMEKLGIKHLDLSKGDENYKLAMGGKIYYTYDFTIRN